MCNVDKRTFWRVLFYESRDGWFKNCGFYHADLGKVRVNGRKLGKDMDMMEAAGQRFSVGIVIYQKIRYTMGNEYSGFFVGNILLTGGTKHETAYCNRSGEL